MLGLLGAGLVLGSWRPTPLQAQTAREVEPTPEGETAARTVQPARHYHARRAGFEAEPNEAPTQSPHADSQTKPAGPAAGVTDRSAAGSQTSAGGDDLESQPYSAFEQSRAAAPAEDTGSLALSVVGKLGLVVALMLAGAAGWKRFRGMGAPRDLPAEQGLQVLSSVALGPQRFLHLVNAGSCQMVVGSSAQNVSLIAILEGDGGRVVSPAASGHPSSAAAAPPGGRAAPADLLASPGAEIRGDDFEELLLRLREMETDPGAGYPSSEVRAAAGRTREPVSSRRPVRGMPDAGFEPARGGEPLAGYAGAGPSRSDHQRTAGDEWAGSAGGRSPRSAHTSPYHPDDPPAARAPAEPVAAGAGSRFAGGYGDAGTEPDPERALAPGSLFRTSRAPSAVDPDA